jgi:hypothetical protein
MRIWTCALALLLIVSLAACAPKQTTTPSTPAPLGPLTADYDGALSPVQQLVVGTFLLVDGDLAVTGEQARMMATLWKGYRALSAKESASVQEMQGLSQQLVESMTEEQLRAIAEMRLIREDMDAVMVAQGVRNAGTGGTGLNEEQRATRVAQRAAPGEMPGGFGGGPGGGRVPGGFGGGQGGAEANGGATVEQLATLRAQRAETGATMVPAALLEALIALLEASA